MSNVLQRWNHLAAHEAEQEIIACCGSGAWARRVAERRPFVNETVLLSAADEAWSSLGRESWLEAFRSHPRIGEARAEQTAHARSAAWSSQEQQKAATGDDVVKMALAEANREYERRFNRIFIVCASGKTAAEILEILRRRLNNSAEDELIEAAEQQRQIMHLRIKRWLGE